MKLTNNIKLTSGRIIIHTRNDNGSQQATPIPGSEYMTEAEWSEYCDLLTNILKRDPDGEWVPRR